MNADLAHATGRFLAPSKRFSGYLERVSILEALGTLRVHVRPGKILDVGCGLKPYQELLTPPGSVYYGADYPVTMAGSYRQATRADVFADCQALPFGPDVFDTVISTQVLEHAPEPLGLVREIARVLQPGGTLILSAPMVWALHEEPHDYYRYTIHGLRALFQRAGLEVLAEVQRGRAASALGQVILDLHAPDTGGRSWLRKLYHAALSLAVNQTCGWLDRWAPNRRLCLGWAVAARKPKPR